MKRRTIVVAVVVAVFALVVSGISVYADDAAKVNINTASAEELAQLQGVGPKYAAKIVEYRDKAGPFAAPEDLKNVPGIGEKTFEKNKDLIVVE